jgi:hypothetical protein
MLEVIAIDIRHLDMVLAMVGRIVSGRISRKMALLFNGIDPQIRAQAFIVIIKFVIN